VSEVSERFVERLVEWCEGGEVVSEGEVEGVEGVSVWSEVERLRWFGVFGVSRVESGVSEVEVVVSGLREVLRELGGVSGLSLSGESEVRVLGVLRELRERVSESCVRVREVVRV